MFGWLALTVARACARARARGAVYDGGGPDVNTGDGWAVFGLEPVLHWPLQLVFDSDSIAKYNTVLQFFYRVFRVQTRLHQTWVRSNVPRDARDAWVPAHLPRPECLAHPTMHPLINRFTPLLCCYHELASLFFLLPFASFSFLSSCDRTAVDGPV